MGSSCCRETAHYEAYHMCYDDKADERRYRLRMEELRLANERYLADLSHAEIMAIIDLGAKSFVFAQRELAATRDAITKVSETLVPIYLASVLKSQEAFNTTLGAVVILKKDLLKELLKQDVKPGLAAEIAKDFYEDENAYNFKSLTMTQANLKYGLDRVFSAYDTVLKTLDSLFKTMGEIIDTIAGVAGGSFQSRMQILKFETKQKGFNQTLLANKLITLYTT